MIAKEYIIPGHSTPTSQLRMTEVLTLHKDKVLLYEHHHTEIEIGLYNSFGEYSIDGIIYHFQPGDIFIFPSNTDHRILKLERNSDLKVLNIFLEPTLIWSPGNGMFNPRYLNVFSRPEFNYHLPAGDPFNAQLTMRLLDIRKEFCDRLPEYESMVKVHLLAILIEITRHYNPQEQITASPANEENLICLEHAIEYIMTNLTASLTLNDIARHAGLSRTYFSTIFKKMNGISVWDFITIKRIDLAIHYLTQTSKYITEIAGLCGFNSTTNFNYAFKKITSLSPGVYRKSI